MKPFPVGGSRQAVYDFLQQRGFLMSRHSDKSWMRPSDGVEVHVYGAGSQARVFGKDGKMLADGPLADAVKRSYGDGERNQ